MITSMSIRRPARVHPHAQGRRGDRRGTGPRPLSLRHGRGDARDGAGLAGFDRFPVPDQGRRLRDDIPLTKSLALGETHTLEYWTSFHLPGISPTREREFRRAALSSLENFDLRVEFHRTCCRTASGGWSGKACRGDRRAGADDAGQTSIRPTATALPGEGRRRLPLDLAGSRRLTSPWPAPAPSRPACWPACGS